MTKEQQAAAWQSLPEDFKRQLRCDYTAAESAHSLDPTNVRIEAHKNFLDMYFGKHNLTATEQEPPLKATAAESLIQMAKAEMGVANDDMPKPNALDWLAYRMELAKEVVKKTAFRDETPKDIVDATMTIVDGIVKRLKGGEK